MNIDKILTVALFLLSATSGLLAQRPDLYWSVDMSAVFDNREGDTKYAPAKTFFQTQLSPEIGISLYDDRHRIAAGAVWTQPIGCEWEGHRISPTVYYRYQSKGLRFAMGMFGRDQLYAEMPNYIWNDSVKYSQRNIRGAMIGYRNEKGYFQAFIDWRGMQTETQREAFNIIASGERRHANGKFLWGGLAMMNHLALDKSGKADQYVIDNLLYNPYVGIDIAKIAATSPLDSCTLRAGVLGDLTRDRGDRQWRTPLGFWADFDIAWKFLELKNTFYAGGKLYPLYGKYNFVLDQGEPYYAASLYNRTSASIIFLKRKFMTLKASLDFNIAPSHFNFYQRVLISFSI
ncbi:MAG: hypothetical protein K2L45_05900 [Muribaculaceae bacterium]|nr:hypothetical protein [Muribaculaceae bacterium]